MSNIENVLVIGGTGMQGAPIVDELAARGYKTTALSRKAMSGSRHESGKVYGDLGERDSLESALEGIDAIVAVFPLLFDAKTLVGYAENLVGAAREASMRRLVFDTSIPVPPDRVGVAAIDTKIAIENVLRDADLDLTIIRPTIYMGNLAAPWTAPEIVQHQNIVYPLAKAVQCAWISWEDVAKCVVAALEQSDTIGLAFDVGGPEALSGDEVAEAFATGRGVPHEYVAVPLDGFEAGLTGILGEDAAREIRKLYGWLNSDGSKHLSPAHVHTERLGVKPIRMSEWLSTVPWEKL